MNTLPYHDGHDYFDAIRPTILTIKSVHYLQSDEKSARIKVDADREVGKHDLIRLPNGLNLLVVGIENAVYHVIRPERDTQDVRRTLITYMNEHQPLLAFPAAFFNEGAAIPTLAPTR